LLDHRRGELAGRLLAMTARHCSTIVGVDPEGWSSR
jgi:hypothetical protein